MPLISLPLCQLLYIKNMKTVCKVLPSEGQGPSLGLSDVHLL